MSFPQIKLVIEADLRMKRRFQADTMILTREAVVTSFSKDGGRQIQKTAAKLAETE